MKVVTPKEGSQKKPAPFLPLMDEEECYTLDKSNSVSWELSTQPGTAGAVTYKFQGRILDGSESPRQILRWRNSVEKVIAGLNVTTYETTQPIIEAMMRAGPLATFHEALTYSKNYAYQQALAGAADNAARAAVTANGVDHYRDVAHMTYATGAVVTSLLPMKILAKVKRSVRRDMRKPADMKVRQYHQCLYRINTEEIPNLPPYAADQALSDEEMIEIILFGTPKSWQVEMDRQAFDPMTKTVREVVEFMENIEAAEATSFKMVEGKKKSSDKSKSDKSSKDKHPTKKKAPYYCKVHGPNYSHDTKDCRGLKDKNEESGSKNKVWSRKSEESKTKTKKELAALVSKAVAKGVKKELAAISKGKRKASNDDSSEDGECFLLDELQKGIDGFNYEDMEKLSIMDEDEISDEVSV